MTDTSWQLDRSVNNGTWTRVYEGPSCDACKRWAKAMLISQHAWGGKADFRIYALHGEQLVWVYIDNRTHGGCGGRRGIIARGMNSLVTSLNDLRKEMADEAI